jgi:peptide deformylase
MATRPIIYSENPILRQKSLRVKRVDSDVQQLVEDMIETMHTADGIGLAAIQIGVPERIIVVQLPEDMKDAEGEEDEGRLHPEAGKLYVVINPELVRASHEMEDGIEGCLSVPGWIGEVSRHQSITVRGMDRQGKRVRIKADGVLARVFQHEMDHCDGVLFTDHIEDMEKLWPVEEGQEEAAEAAQAAPGV